MIQFITAWNGYEYGDIADFGIAEDTRLISARIAKEFVNPESISGFGERLIYNPSAPSCVIPSLNAGTATASQSGHNITVTTSVAHNLSTALSDRIDNTGAMVYLNMAAGAIAAGWYINLDITSATTFTCVSAISQTVASQTVTPLGGTAVEVTPLKFSVGANIAKAKSQIKYNFSVAVPAIGVARGCIWRTAVVNHANDATVPLISENTTSTAASSKFVDGLIVFLDDKAPSSDLMHNAFGNVGDASNVVKRISANGDVTNIRPSAGFEVVPVALFFGGGLTASDWIVFDMARYELLV